MLNFDEFLGMFDPKNPFTPRAVRQMRTFNADDSMLFKKKSNDLVEVVEDFCSRKAFPIVDKRLGVVLGVGDGYHRLVRALLFNYNTSDPKEPDVPPASIENASTWYLMNGSGYFISAMRPRVIVAGHEYREDRFDKDLFQLYEVDRTI